MNSSARKLVCLCRHIVGSLHFSDSCIAAEFRSRWRPLGFSIGHALWPLRVSAALSRTHRTRIGPGEARRQQRETRLHSRTGTPTAELFLSAFRKCVSPERRRNAARSCLAVLALLNYLTLTGCATSTPRSPEPPSPSPLVVASCPELAPLTDPSFGATTLKLIEVAGQYRECRAAALAK